MGKPGKLALPSHESTIGKFLTQSGTFKDGDLLVNKDGLRIVPQSEEGEAPIEPLDNYQLSIDDLDAIKVIGKGSSGIVQLVQHKWTGQFFALKVIQLNIQESIRKQIVQELKISLSTQCQYVVVCYQCFYVNGVISIALEYMDGGSLADFLKAVRTVPEAYLAAICKQVLKGLMYLHHEKHIIHGDLKPSNILINHRGEVKISDFGPSAIIATSSAQRDTFTDTFNYMAPERISGQKHGYMSDIWSLGLVILECATGNFTYHPHDSFYELLEAVVDKPPPSAPSDQFSAEFCSFISACIQKEATDRSSAQVLLTHPFLSLYDDLNIDLADYRDAGRRTQSGTFKDGDLLVNKDGLGIVPQSTEGEAEMSSWLGVTNPMEACMSSSLGAMGPVLRKLDSLLLPKYRLSKPLQDGIRLLKEDLEEISAALYEQSTVHSPNEMSNYWMNEVREISYDIDDFLDDMMLRHTKIRYVRRHRVGRVKTAWRSKTLKPCTRAAKIAELRALVREASERHDMYLDGCTTSPRCMSTTGHGQTPALYAVAANYLVGIDDSKTNLVQLLTDETEQQLKVVAIVGPAGVGKTTLANQVYRELEGQFECRAFVRASRKPDMRRLLAGILSQVQQCSGPSDSCTVQDLIDNLIKHLQDKRYVIVIDDLWETIAWDIVTSAFPEGNNCSRIVTTAQIEGVALECCDYQSNNILKVKPLGREDSMILLSNMVYGPERSWPEQLKEVSDITITKCAGLPLAIICVAGLLASQLNNSEVRQHVQGYLCSNLSTNSNLEETLQEILKLSYNSLPHYLKTCLMYLSMYPEGYTMWKDDLVKQWVAECFISATEGQDREEVAESYFDELVNRGVIQPVEISYNDKVLSCTVHQVLLDLTIHKSNEEKFITALDYSQTITGLYRKAHRLSLHFSNTRYATKPTALTLSKLRSLAFFGMLKCMPSFGMLKCVPSIVKFKLLRVLILEFWGDLVGCTSIDLRGICRLFQLRYLKISGDVSIEVELPARMRRLQYLETLEINARVSAVPLDLPGLLHLSLRDETKVPYGIGRVRSLRTLEYFDLGKNSRKSVLSLGALINLQDLRLTYSTVNSPNLLKRKLAALASSIAKLVNLKSVTLAPGALDTAIYHDCSSSVFSPPVFLQRLELLSPICIFSRIPEWIGQLNKLCIIEVVVSGLLMKDMDMLTGLPALTILSLYVRQPTTESIIFKREAFPALKYFKYTCGVLSLVFQEEALPNLHRLELSFNAHRGERYGYLLAGIEHLPNLKEITGTIGPAAGADERDIRAAESAFKDAIRKHPRFPSYDSVKRVDRVDEEYNLRSQEDANKCAASGISPSECSGSKNFLD